MRRWSRLMAGDLGLCATVLKKVNSPFFGLSGRIGSTAQAVNQLGLAATVPIVTSLALKAVFGDRAASLERFCDS
ncbi:HDOD domain-containing protein [Accumulibacter sp.]|uniref:HDOD domain-containing protein n=1 Tax=Accumulibacter sp. TaxID=2053492 RepID=UPI00257DCDFD|nr:HDOD domain-containing protein [Accumulibacter sp.]